MCRFFIRNINARMTVFHLTLDTSKERIRSISVPFFKNTVNRDDTPCSFFITFSSKYDQIKRAQFVLSQVTYTDCAQW